MLESVKDKQVALRGSSQVAVPLRPPGRLSRFTHDEGGVVAIISALALAVILGFAGLALEYGQALALQAHVQRTADLASHAGAVAYGQTNSELAMENAAKGVARLNGINAGEIVVVLTASDRSSDGQGVRVTITRPKSLILPRLVGGDPSVEVRASALAGTLAGEPACVQALDPSGRGIVMTGSAQLLAPNCAVASNAMVTAPCGTGIVTETLTYNAGSDPSQCNSVRSPNADDVQIAKRPTVDPLAGTSVLGLAQGIIAEAAALMEPAGPLVASGPNMHFSYDQNATKALAVAAGCNASFSSPRWTFSCPGTTVNLGNLTIGGGLELLFNPTAGPHVTYNFSGRITNTGKSMIFAGGTYNIAGGIHTGGGTVTNFGVGSFAIGRSAESCDGARYSICNSSRLSFEGPSTFVLVGGARVTGRTATGEPSLILGTENGNSFRFGPSSNGNALSIGDGSVTVLGDAQGGTFEAVGQIQTGGGSCLFLPAAQTHHINGSIVASGAMRFGSGTYAVTGMMHLGSGGGGGVTCQGRTISVEANDTTFLISGTGSAPFGSSCTNAAFCVGAGYSNIQMTAPQSGPFAGFSAIGPLDPASTARGASFVAGASGSQVSGTFYFPNGPITTQGGASVAGTPGGCLQLIGAEIIMSGGTSVASECAMATNTAIAQVVLLE